MQPDLFDGFSWWRMVRRCDARARALVDGEVGSQGAPHYSRQTVGAAEFMGNGRTYVLLGRDDLSVWGVIHNRAPVPPQHMDAWRRGAYVPETRWRCSIFRRDPSSAGPRASELVRAATELTYASAPGSAPSAYRAYRGTSVIRAGASCALGGRSFASTTAWSSLWRARLTRRGGERD